MAWCTSSSQRHLMARLEARRFLVLAMLNWASSIDLSNRRKTVRGLRLAHFHLSNYRRAIKAAVSVQCMSVRSFPFGSRRISATGRLMVVAAIPRIVDGDTLAIGATKVRLEGIDAPETDQVCLNANGVYWTCGIDARDQLAANIASRDIECSSHDADVYRRTLATCYLAGEDLNGWLVQQGWALAYVQYSSAYRQVEEEARTKQRGLLQGAFIAPWDWRHRNNKTVILG